MDRKCNSGSRLDLGGAPGIELSLKFTATSRTSRIKKQQNFDCVWVDFSYSFQYISFCKQSTLVYEYQSGILPDQVQQFYRLPLAK